MEVKEAKTEVYKVECPVCGKVFYGVSESRVIDRLDQHLASHEKEVEKDEETGES